MYITIRTLAVIALLCFAALPLQAASTVQDSTSGDARGSVKGKVTLDGKPASGIIILMKKFGTGKPEADDEQPEKESLLKSTTDGQGHYSFSDVPVGQYSVYAHAPALVSSTEKRSQASITVTEGQTIEVSEFAMSRSGVITGKVVDQDGRPVIRGSINVSPSNESSGEPKWYSNGSGRLMTDDRGIYRAYGLAPGRYVVSVNVVLSFIDLNASQPTYYPGVTDNTRAKVVEVTAGGEVSGVDIKLAPKPKGFSASGRIFEEDTGKPIANAVIAAMPAGEREDFNPFSGGVSASSARGEFRLENLQPGSYKAIGQVIRIGNEYYVEPVEFEVKSGDVTGLEIKLKRGSSISGIVVVEGVVDGNIGARLSRTVLTAQVIGEGAEGSNNDFSFGAGVGKVEADGSFKLSGLRSGRAIIMAQGGESPRLLIARVEHNGADVKEGIDLRPSENITGVRVVMGVANGVVRGKVTLPTGISLDSVYVHVAVYEPGKEEAEGSGRIEADGSFTVRDLLPGVYEIEAIIASKESGDRKGSSGRQSVAVTADVPAEVTLSVVLK